MKEFLHIAMLFTFIFLCSCDPQGDNNSDDSGDEFAQRSKMCQSLDAEKCIANKACELVANVCLARLPTVFAIETPNLPNVDKELVGRQITALSNGPANQLYVGTDEGLIISSQDSTEKIVDFSGGNAALAGLKYVRAIGYSPIGTFAYASIGSSAAPKDPNSKIIYEITQKAVFSTPAPSPLVIFESTPGVTVFGGENVTRYDILGARKYKRIATQSGVTTAVFNPNGSTLWFGTGGADVANHKGILFNSAQLIPIVVSGENGIAPSTWGSTAASPNADISSMTIVGNHILVGLRAKDSVPQSGGLVVFDIYQANKAMNGKPFLLGTDVRKIIVGEFAHGNAESNRKKNAIIMATGAGLYEVKLAIERATASVSVEATLLDKDREGNTVELKEVDHLIQRNQSFMYFSSNNKLYFLEVK